MTIHYQGHGVTLHHGDCLDVLRTLPDASVDSVVTDPPYGLEFMGKDWDAPWKSAANSWADRDAEDHAQPENRGQTASPFLAAKVNKFAAGLPFQQWCELWAVECLRVLKPGGYLISAGGSRTYHRMTSGVEDAGFEIRDCITWHFGSGFPKSRNVSLDLARIPACACDVSGELGTVDASLPPGAVGAGVGAEAGAVGLAGLATDAAVGVGPQVVAPGATGLGAQDVHALDVDLCGHGLPVVLGSPGVAGDAEREQIVGSVRGVEVEPEALRDEVVSEQPVDGSAISAGPVALDDAGSDVGPASPLVLPLPATPSGVALAVEAAPVVDGHAGARAVGAGVGPSVEALTADRADVDSVPLASSHASHSTAERLARCEDCGGLRGEIPQGLGTALKPAAEFFVVARKPLAGTVAGNVLAWGTGALNIDATRIEHRDAADLATSQAKNPGRSDTVTSGVYGAGRPQQSVNTAGRWPANVVLDEHQAVVLDEMSGEAGGGTGRSTRGGGDGGDWNPTDRTEKAGQTVRGDGREIGYGDLGGASRFFYVAKADATERPRVNGTAHPTVKPLSLMRWLVRLVTPPGGTVLEPFAGSGTTVEACIVEGFDCIAIEKGDEYLPLIMQRIHRRRDPVAAIRQTGDELGLFELDGEGA